MIQILEHLLIFLGKVIGGFFDWAAETLGEILSTRKTEYSADFVPASNLLSAFSNKNGFCLTGKRCLSIEESFSNGIVFGGSGSGKSAIILTPSILKMAGHSSLIIHTPSGEEFQKNSGLLEQAGYKIKVVNYNRPDQSEGFNPLFRAKTSSEIQKLSKVIVHNSLGQGKSDPFWNISAEGLISFFAKYIVAYQPKEYHTLHNVLYLINTFASSTDVEKIDKLIVRTQNAYIITEYKTINSYDKKVLMNIIATVRAALSIFTDEKVSKITSFDTLDFENFRTEKTALFIINSVNDMKYFSCLSSIFFEQCWSEVMKSIPKEDSLPIFFLLDESSSLYLNSLPIVISNIRKYRAGILQIYQDHHQLIDLYGQAQARNIIANSYAKVYMKGQPIAVAQELEATLGRFQFKDENEKEHIRPLMTADEIRQLNDSLILIGNNPPIKAKMFPYYKQFNLKRLTEIPPYQFESKLPSDIPPLIQFE